MPHFKLLIIILLAFVLLYIWAKWSDSRRRWQSGDRDMAQALVPGGLTVEQLEDWLGLPTIERTELITRWRRKRWLDAYYATGPSGPVIVTYELTARGRRKAARSLGVPVAQSQDPGQQLEVRRLNDAIRLERDNINQLEAQSRFRGPSHTAMDMARARGRLYELEEALKQARSG